MINRNTETKWFIGSLLFAILYCLYLFFFRELLANLEKNPGEILKPEPGQIFAVSLLIIIYHFAFTGIFAFAVLGKWQVFVSIFFLLLIHIGLLYGFKLWYEAITEGVLIFFGSQQSLPWYAEEKNKFLLANGPLLFYFMVVFIYRFVDVIKQLRY